MSPRKPSYTPLPKVPPQLMPRLAGIVEVLAGAKTVSEAARTLGLSRNHFQTILHRGLLALVEAITIKAGGRPGSSPKLVQLQKQLTQLERENRRLKKQVDSTDRLLEVAGELLHGRLRPSARQRRTRKNPGGSGEGREESDPEIRRRELLRGVTQMRNLGVSGAVAARIAGVDVSTLRRWRSKPPQPWPPQRCYTARCLPLPLLDTAEELVRRLHGLIGADALSHSVEGLTRRTAAAIKRHTLTAIERERKAGLVRVRIGQPGVLRGLDAMHLSTAEGAHFALIGADGAVPYRTSLSTGAPYDEPLVARALRKDFEDNGAPLVIRLDRAKAHLSVSVRDVLREYGVLALHGPPRYPCFYGQLERQNREHRAWLEPVRALPRRFLEPCLVDMLDAVNRLWRRRTLGWKSAAEVWSARPGLDVDRNAFREEVHERAIRIARSLQRRSQPEDWAERLAIERTLERMGYLSQEIGGWC